MSLFWPLNKFRALVLVTFSFVAISLGYTNCGRIGESNLIDQSSLIDPDPKVMCEKDLRKIYDATYYPILSFNCSIGCHQHATQHGSTVKRESFLGFMAYGQELIHDVADPNFSNPHDTRFNKINVSKKMNDVLPVWQAGFAEYESCMIKAGAGQEQHFLLTKLVPVTNLVRPTGTQTAAWQAVSFDLESPRDPGLNGKIPAELIVDVSYWMSSGNTSVMGLKFKKPRLRIKTTGKTVAIANGMNLRIEGKVNDEVKEVEIRSFTAYANLSKSISTTTESLLVESVYQNVESLADFPGFDSMVDKVAFYINDIRVSDTVDTSPVTWTKLTSSGGAFATKCLVCHTGASSPKGVDLSNYTNSKTNAQKILNSVLRNGQATAMPASGPVSEAEKQAIQAWVQAGAPQ